MQRLEDIEALNKAMLFPADVSEYLRCNPYSINIQAKEDAKKLGFPVVIIGTRVLIPKDGFINYMRYGGKPPFLSPQSADMPFRPEGLRVKGYKFVGRLVPVYEAVNE